MTSLIEIDPTWPNIPTIYELYEEGTGKKFDSPQAKATLALIRVGTLANKSFNLPKGVDKAAQEAWSEALRKTMKQEHPETKLTLTSFFMKAVVVLLKEMPRFNTSLDPTGESLIFKHYFNVGVAVDTPRQLFSTRSGNSWATASDGERFVIGVPEVMNAGYSITLVVDWQGKR